MQRGLRAREYDYRLVVPLGEGIFQLKAVICCTLRYQLNSLPSLQREPLNLGITRIWPTEVSTVGQGRFIRHHHGPDK